MTLGQQVKTERERQQMTQDELKSKANISLDTLCRIEQDRNSNPTLYVIKQLQKVLNVKFDL